MTVTADHNLHKLTGQSAGGKMVFRGSLSKPSQVTVGGNAATSGYYSTNFYGMANVVQGTNNVPIIAADVNGNVSTNKYQVVIPPSSGSYTYDLNGNLLTDGSKTYSYDAKNELVKITYADTSYTTFTYNGSGARVEIQEYNSSHSLTSTKWFVGNEERDGSNTTTRRYFSQGEQRIVSGTATNYFYTHDHLGSIREMIDASGTIQARYSYDPFGRRTQVSGSLICDFGFTGYYHHAASGLDLSATRAYDSNTGRFTQRDPSGEASGLNLYAYCGGDPINLTDASGLAPNTFLDPSVLNNPFDNSSMSNLTVDSVGCMESQPLNPMYSQAQLAQLAIARLIAQGWSPELAALYINAGAFAMNHDTALETTNYILQILQMFDGAGEVEMGVENLAVHGNSLKSLKPTWVYKLFSNDGTFLKNGITSQVKAENRYTKSFMSDKYMEKELYPNRASAYKAEAEANQAQKGPLNLNDH